MSVTDQRIEDQHCCTGSTSTAHDRRGDRPVDEVGQHAGHESHRDGHEQFETDLAAYALSVLHGWTRSGFIFTLVASHGFALHPSDTELTELATREDARADLSIMTVATALPRFRLHALVGGRWRMDSGACLTTYFISTCLYSFPNEMRRWRAQRRRWHLQDRSYPSYAAQRDVTTNDPADLVVGRTAIRSNLTGEDARTRAVVALTMDGYTQEEIAELLAEPSIRAVEGVLRRWRRRARLERGRGGDGS